MFQKNQIDNTTYYKDLLLVNKIKKYLSSQIINKLSFLLSHFLLMPAFVVNGYIKFLMFLKNISNNTTYHKN